MKVKIDSTVLKYDTLKAPRSQRRPTADESGMYAHQVPSLCGIHLHSWILL